MKAYVALLGLLLVLFACTKDTNGKCYDQSLVHNNPCTADCPGVCGCDGKTYCNGCEANRVGISVVKDKPCQ